MRWLFFLQPFIVIIGQEHSHFDGVLVLRICKWDQAAASQVTREGHTNHVGTKHVLWD